MFDLDLEFSDNSVSGREIKMVLLRRGRRRGRGGIAREVTTFFGLLIHKAGPSKPGMFYRIGMFESDRWLSQSEEAGVLFFEGCNIQSVEII